MSELVERLKRTHGPTELILEATARIEALEAALEKALWLLDNGPDNPNAWNSAAACLPGDGNACEPILDEAISVLRAALANSDAEKDL